MTRRLDQARTSIGQAIPRPDAAAQFAPEDDVGVFESLGQGYLMGNLTATAIRGVDALTEDFEEDPDFQPGNYLRGKPELSWLLEMTKQDSDLFESVGTTRSANELEFMAGNLRDSMERSEKAFANPTAGVVGMLSGGILDLPSLIPGGALLKGFGSVVQTVKAARMAGAARGALFGATEGAGFAAFESAVDPRLGLSDVFAASGIGLVGGAAIGGAIPRFAGVRRSADSIPADDAEDALAGAVRREGREPPAESAGAAAARPVEELAEQVPQGTQAVGSRFLGKLPVDFLRSPLQRAQNWVADPAYKANEVVHEAAKLYGRFNRWSAPTAGEVAGTHVRGRRSVQEVLHEQNEEAAAGAIQREIFYNDLEAAAPNLMKMRLDVGVGDSTIPFLVRGVTPDRLHLWSWNWSQQQNVGADIADYVRTLGIKELRQDEEKALQEAIEKTAATDNEFFQRWLKRNVDAGFMTAEDVPQGNYRPQQYNVENILLNEDDFVDLLMENFNWNPPEEWLLANGFLAQGQKWADLPADLKSEARAEATIQRSKRIEDRADAKHEEALAILGAAKGDAADAAEARWERKLKELDRQITYRDKRFRSSKNPSDTDRWLRLLGEAEENKRQATKALAEARKRFDDVDQLRAELKKVSKTGNILERARARMARLGLTRAETAAEDAAVEASQSAIEQADLEKLARGIKDRIVGASKNRDNPFGFLPEDATSAGQAGRFQPRNIDWGPIRSRGMDNRLNEFLMQEPELGIEGYKMQVGSRHALQEAFETTDLTEIVDDVARRMPVELREDFRKDIEHMFEQATGRYLSEKPGVRAISTAIKNYNIMGMLGSAGFSLWPDLGLGAAAFRTPRVDKFVRKFFTGESGRVFKTAKQLRKPVFSALIVGADHAAHPDRRLRRLMNQDDGRFLPGAGAPGTPQWKLYKTLDKAGKVGSAAMMRLNLMNWWDTRLSAAFRLAFMTDALEDFAKPWDQISQARREGFLSMGVGQNEAARLRKRFEEFNFEIEGTRLPDVDKWPAKDFALFRRLIDETAREARVAPTIGTQPRLANAPVGQLFFQFMSFPYEVQQRLVRRWRQNPKDPMMLQAALFSTMMASLADFARHAVVGEADAWADGWGTPEGVSQHMFNAFVRGPYSVAYSSALFDQMSILGGRAGNHVLQNAGLPPLLPQPARLRERDFFTAVGGPAVSNINNIAHLAVTAGGAMAGIESDIDALPDAMRRGLPFGSHAVVRGLDAALGDD